MKKKKAVKIASVLLAAAMTGGMLAGCGGSGSAVGSAPVEENADEITFPLAEKATLTGMISYPTGTEEEPNNRTIFKRLEEETNVHVDWVAISSDQWSDKISLNMANLDSLTDFVFNAGFSDSDLLKYADQGVIVSVDQYIDSCMPNLKAVFDAYPEYRTMCEDEDGHIWAFPWIEQLGSDKTAIQTLGNNMCFSN